MRPGPEARGMNFSGHGRAGSLPSVTRGMGRGMQISRYPDLGYSVDRGSIGVFGRKAVCTAVCTFDSDGQEVSQCLRTVGQRPDSNDFRMQSYAPYALPLKGKRPKRLQLPKEVHKVHTALCMRSQPYSRLASCSSRKSAYGLHTAAYEVHTDG